jgi:phosphate transport system protein
MREAFNEQLRGVLERLMEMGGLVESTLQLAAQAVVEQQHATVEVDLLEREDRINKLQNEIDEECVRITARQQPVASDARFLFVASRAATDLERAGDQAVNVLDNGKYLWQRGGDGVHIPDDLPVLAQLVHKMVSDALTSLVTRDIDLAEAVFADEERANNLRDAIFRVLLRQMITDPLAAQQSMSLVLISRNLERVGDHATNIAEEVVYLVRGQEIRHKFDRSNRMAG